MIIVRPLVFSFLWLLCYSSWAQTNTKGSVERTTPHTEVRDETLYRFLLRGQGYFKNAFEESLDVSAPMQQLVKATVFKTQSGYSDQKFYVLTNLAPVGSFVYLYADAQSRGVYAKVIGPLHDIRLNIPFDLRVSAAAVPILGINETGSFSLTLYYWPSSNR
jgi:hypothetical protein